MGYTGPVLPEERFNVVHIQYIKLPLTPQKRGGSALGQELFAFDWTIRGR